jgi:uncharacterized phage protein (TIGR02216 family)
VSAEIDWRRLAEVATGILGWTSEAFWSATPAEFWTAWHGWRSRFFGEAPQPLARTDLTQLMTQFPDPPS